MSRHGAIRGSVAGEGLGILCALLAGCGFGPGAGRASEAPGDAAGDAGTDDIDAAKPVTGCFPKWLDHTLQINASAVAEITELSSDRHDRNPWISDDGLRMYFSREQDGDPNTSDVYFASRPSTTQSFGTPTTMVNLNSALRDARTFLTSDELTLVMSTARDGQLDILMTTRPATSGFGSPDGRYTGMVNKEGTLRADPSISTDLLRLYLSANTAPQNRLRLLTATRESATSEFSKPSPIPGTGHLVNSQTDPTLYSDERLLVFSEYPPAALSGDLWYATRSKATDGFGSAVQIPGVNTLSAEFDPVLSADGCEVYFASTRRDGRFHLFRAPVTK